METIKSEEFVNNLKESIEKTLFKPEVTDVDEFFQSFKLAVIVSNSYGIQMLNKNNERFDMEEFLTELCNDKAKSLLVKFPDGTTFEENYFIQSNKVHSLTTYPI